VILALDHVQVTVPPEKEAAARAFYGQVVGLAEIPKPPALAARGGAWFRLGGAELHIAIEDGVDRQAPASRRHIALQVGDLAAAEKRFRARGSRSSPTSARPTGFTASMSAILAEIGSN